MAAKKEPEKRDLVKPDEDMPTLPSEDIIQPGKSEVLDLTGLTEEQIQEIKKKYADAMVEVAHKAAEVGG